MANKLPARTPGRKPSGKRNQAHSGDREGAIRTRGGRLEEVQEAALTLFARDGYARTNMTDIAREMRLVAPSLYNHISSKSDVLRTICVRTMNELLELQREAMEEPDVARKLQALTAAHVTFSASRRREMVVTNREFNHLDDSSRAEVLALRHRYERGFRSVIEEGRIAGVFDVREPKLASYAIIEMGMSVVGWFREGGRLSLPMVANEYAMFALRVVGHREELG